jgi:hypothetical protein
MLLLTKEEPHGDGIQSLRTVGIISCSYRADNEAEYQGRHIRKDQHPPTWSEMLVFLIDKKRETQQAVV